MRAALSILETLVLALVLTPTLVMVLSWEALTLTPTSNLVLGLTIALIIALSPLRLIRVTVRGCEERRGRTVFKGDCIACLHLHQSAIISFVKKPPPDPRDKFATAVSTSDLPNERKQFFFSRAARDRVGHFLSRSAPGSGNAATLPTLQMESQHAASATPTAFWRRKHGHERQPAHPCM